MLMKINPPAGSGFEPSGMDVHGLNAIFRREEQAGQRVAAMDAENPATMMDGILSRQAQEQLAAMDAAPAVAQAAVAEFGAGLSHFRSELAKVETRVYERKYSSVRYQELYAPGDILAGGGYADSIVYYVKDVVGQGEFGILAANNVPQVQVRMKQVTVPLEVAFVGGNYALQDILAAGARKRNSAPGLSPQEEIMTGMRKVSEEHIDRVNFYGEPRITGYEGYYSNSAVEIGDVADSVANPNGATGAALKLFKNKTPDEMVADVNDAISDVILTTRENHFPGTVRLASEPYNVLAATRMSGQSDVTVLQYLRKNNAYTARTHKELDIISDVRLDGAGVGGANRMVVAEKEQFNVMTHHTIPLVFLPVQQTAMHWNLYGYYQFGPAEIRYPKSLVYRDGM